MTHDNKKETERAELHRTIWKIAEELRGSVDGWDFKNYVLGILFYRFISENITQYINNLQHKAGATNFDYVKFNDEASVSQKELLVKTKGFFIKPSELFENVRKNAQHDEDLNITLANVFKSIEIRPMEQNSKVTSRGFSTMSTQIQTSSAQLSKNATKLCKKSLMQSAILNLEIIKTTPSMFSVKLMNF